MTFEPEATGAAVDVFDDATIADGVADEFEGWGGDGAPIPNAVELKGSDIGGGKTTPDSPVLTLPLGFGVLVDLMLKFKRFFVNSKFLLNKKKENMAYIGDAVFEIVGEGLATWDELLWFKVVPMNPPLEAGIIPDDEEEAVDELIETDAVLKLCWMVLGST